MLLSVMKQGGQRYFLGQLFKIKSSTFGKLVIRYVKVVWEETLHFSWRKQRRRTR